jgi:hypothetical protein
VNSDVDGGLRRRRLFTPRRKRGCGWWYIACSFFVFVRYTTESSRVRGVVNIVEEMEAKMVTGGCIGQKHL